jgi:hypothetical protein
MKCQFHHSMLKLKEQFSTISRIIQLVFQSGSQSPSPRERCRVKDVANSSNVPGVSHTLQVIGERGLKLVSAAALRSADDSEACGPQNFGKLWYTTLSRLLIIKWQRQRKVPNTWRRYSYMRCGRQTFRNDSVLDAPSALVPFFSSLVAEVHMV